MAYTLVATDSFTGVDASPIGGNWTTITGQANMKLASNAIAPASVASDSGALYNTGTWFNDQYAQLKITTVGATQDTGIGPLVRCSGSAYTCYGLYVNRQATNNVTIYKRVAGAFTALARVTQAFTDGDLFKISVQGSSIRAFYKGTQIGATQNDTAVVSGSPGVAYSSASTSASGDDWEAGSIIQLPNNYQFVKAGDGMSVSEKIR